MNLTDMQQNWLNLVVIILGFVSIVSLLPSGILLLKSVRDGQKKVAELEEQDAPADRVFKRAGRSLGVILIQIIFIGLIVILPLVVSGPTGVGAFVSSTFNYFLGLLGIPFSFPVPGT